jgi:hypothetical protein
MSRLWGFFNFGPVELLVLALCFGLPVIAGLIALFVVLGTRKKDEPGND